MCGIAGIVNLDGSKVDLRLLERMNKSIAHRGPDDEGFLAAKGSSVHTLSGDDTIREIKDPHIAKSKFEGSVGLAHRRLSIIDLSPKGHQPMTEKTGKLWIVFNGEIYNYIEIRGELEKKGYKFLSGSDTEVILNAYAEWGAKCLDRFNGMFAFAIYDSKKHQIFCARDRFGVKPFYYYFDGNRFVFASEIKAILCDDTIERRINEGAMYFYIAHGSVDIDEDTFFEGIKKLGHSCYLLIDLDKKTLKKHAWWDLTKTKMPADAVCEFRSLLHDSVRLRLRSDVPVGSCLSGGLDSSYIVCEMADMLGEKRKNVNTFSAVYGAGRHGDESGYIDEVIRKTDVVKHVTLPTADQLMHEMEELIWHQEEPFGSTSIFAQWKVMQLARKNRVKVLLDGQGADEQLAGYHSYFGAYFSTLFKKRQFGRLAKEFLAYVKLHRNIKNSLSFFGYYLASKKLRKQAVMMRVPFSREFLKKFPEKIPHATGNDFNEILKHNTMNLLQQLLRYEDKNSMAFSIETRVPYLDYRLAQLIYTLPEEWKIRRGVTKYVMREAGKGILPENIRLRRSKIGFETPEDEWFRGEMKGFLRKIVESREFSSRPYWDAKEVRKYLDGYLARKRGYDGRTLWRPICTEMWIRAFFEGGKR
jgi:asparagine synthase (glutamine-hydrolysing)